MAIRQRIKKAIEAFRSSEIEQKSTSSTQRVVYIGGRPVFFWFDDITFLEHEIDQVDPNIATAINIVANAISGLPVKIKAKESGTNEISWVEILDHPAYDLITKPNPYHSQIDFFKHIIQSISITKQSWHIIDKSSSGVNALWPIPPWMMMLVLNKLNRPLHYVYDPSNTKKIFKLDEVLHVVNYHMSDPYRGLSPTKAIMDEVQSNDYASEYNKNYFKNNATPDMLFEQPELMHMDKDQEDQFLKSWDAKNKGVENAHGRGMLPPGIKPHIITQPIKDMQFADLVKLNREQIYGYFGIPPSEAGVLEFASYANGLLQKRTLWENRLIPIKRMIEMAINRQIIWPVWGEELRLELDTSGVAALQDDMKTLTDSTVAAYNGGLIMLNEGRHKLGYEPVEDGDIFKPAPANPFSLLDSSADGGKTFAQNSLGVKAVKSPSARESKWLLFDKKARAEEPAYIKGINRYFNNQLSRVLSALKEVSANGVVLSSWLCKANQYFKRESEELPDDIRRFFDITAEDLALEQLIGPITRQVVQKAGESFLSEYGIELTFNVNNEQALTLINALTNRIKGMNDTTYLTLKNMLENAYNEGWPLSKLEKEIRLQYQNWVSGTSMTEARASMIARTETAAAVNGGTLIGYKQGGVEKKEWLASLDSHTRDTHAALDGNIIILTERFANGLDYPGDPSGPAGEVINCRCTILPVIE